MGNNNQSMSPMPSGGSLHLPADSRARQRRTSTSEPTGPLELPFAAGKYNPDHQHANSKDIFSRGLVENEEKSSAKNLVGGDGTDRMETEYVRRYRSGSISMQQPPPLSPPPKSKSPAVFKWDKSGKEVYISGSFNNWERKIPLVKSENNFYTILELEEGSHEYKFYVDGEWTHHEYQPTKQNDQGSLNNVMHIQNEDLNVSDALAKDSSLTSKSPKLDPLTGSTLYPQDVYNSDIPERRNVDKLTGPPVLPPHLLQVILNKDVPAHLEPGLLPEPNHVMLNHLYALSIKDGVMVLSDTSRYKKKYVTTLLYKPIDS